MIAFIRLHYKYLADRYVIAISFHTCTKDKVEKGGNKSEKWRVTVPVELRKGPNDIKFKQSISTIIKM
jgi:hypothetical protein